MNIRPRTRVLAAVLAAATGAATFALSQSPGVAAAADRDDLDDLELRAVLQSEREIDTGRNGISPGDRYVMSEKLYDFDDDDRVGRSSIECVISWVKRNHNGRVVNGAQHCTGVLMLRDGQITATGGFTFRDVGESFSVAVTGGTGDYAGVEGEMWVKELNRKASKLTFDTDGDGALRLGR